MSYEFDCDQQFNQYHQEPEVVSCPECGNPCREVVSKSPANPGRVFYSCNTNPAYGPTCTNPKGFFGWKDERLADGTWQKKFPAKRSTPSGGFASSGQRQLSPRSPSYSSGQSSSYQSQNQSQSHVPAPPSATSAGSSSADPARQERVAGLIATHVRTEVTAALADIHQKLDCVIALLRAQHEEREDSQSSLPRPASST
jgi:hypothetical protein